ncbi:unnamed protein product [Heligmosomoides polygyrus]|uniref:Protein RFT1 homolog n=1 Tax=Heligmosomoides polygyrus TaxID=6339 RepID=A0A183GDI6_HELPZ|nr:unnamed protein product [Heligmosomoides polygyrus]
MALNRWVMAGREIRFAIVFHVIAFCLRAAIAEGVVFTVVVALALVEHEFEVGEEVCRGLRAGRVGRPAAAVHWITPSAP